MNMLTWVRIGPNLVVTEEEKLGEPLFTIEREQAEWVLRPSLAKKATPIRFSTVELAQQYVDREFDSL